MVCGIILIPAGNAYRIFVLCRNFNGFSGLLVCLLVKYRRPAISEKFATKPFSSTHIPFRNSFLSDISPDGTEVTVRRELFKLPAADDAELFCKEVSEFALPAVQEDRNTAVINAVAVIENKNRFFLILIPF